jgi:ABC-2 type transport system permease protein
MYYLRDTWLIFRNQMLLALRNPIWLAFGLIQSVIYLAFFGPLFAKVFNQNLAGGSSNAYAYFLPGILIQLSMFGAAFVGFRLIADWRYGLVDRLRVTPVSRIAILSGRVLRDVVTLVIQSTVLIVAGLIAGLRAPVGGVLIGFGFIGVIALSLSSLSYAAALLTKNEDMMSPVINMLMFPLTLLSGVLLPVTLGPGWLQGIARAVPFRYIVDAMRNAYAGHYLNYSVIEGIGVAAGLAIACMCFGVYAFRRQNA